MWPFIQPISLIRYLIVWRVNTSLLWVPDELVTDFSRVLGNIIADRLPTRQARDWHKALAPWEEAGDSGVPDAAWPIESVLFVYPGKRSYGQGELILWELKLMGESADHGLFLEVILPAMEEAATTTDSRWRERGDLWGQFDIDSIYAARGHCWEPVVKDGKLDLDHRPTPAQWAEGFTFESRTDRVMDRVTWMTPFDIPRSDRDRSAPRDKAPSLHTLLDALIVRMSELLPGKHNTSDDVWDVLEAEERSALEEALELASRIPVQHHKIEPAPKEYAGRWTGEQRFQFIPNPVLPYLELASILHLGKQTHFGCGTFMIT